MYFGSGWRACEVILYDETISYYVSSLPPKVKTLATAIRQHLSIESQLHWVLDVTFTEDASRIRKRHAPQTSAMLRRLAVSILSSGLP